MKNRHEFTFKGDFKRLKEMGYSFQKYFWMNYIGYTWKESAYGGRGIVIWKKGRDISLFDEYIYETRPMIFNFIKNNTINEIREHEFCSRKNGEVMTFKYDKRCEKVLSKYEYSNLEDDTERRTDSFTISLPQINKIKELISFGWIELVYKQEV